MKKAELASMIPDQMKQRIIELRTELAKENSSIASGTRPENPGKIRKMKKDIARLKTYIRQNELGIKAERKTRKFKEKKPAKAAEKPAKAEKKDKKEKEAAETVKKKEVKQ